MCVWVRSCVLTKISTTAALLQCDNSHVCSAEEHLTLSVGVLNPLKPCIVNSLTVICEK